MKSFLLFFVLISVSWGLPKDGPIVGGSLGVTGIYNGPLPMPKDARNGRIWPELRYFIGGSFSAAEIDEIRNTMAYLSSEMRGCLNIYEVFDQASYPRMDIMGVSMGGFCKTTYQWGTFTQSVVELSPGSVCTTRRGILHEVLHGMAYYHTHTREDRDNFVTINFANVLPGKESEFYFCSETWSGQCSTLGMPYDCGSVMHYARDQMSSNGGDTIIARDSSSCVIPPMSSWYDVSPPLSPGDVNMLTSEYC